MKLTGSTLIALAILLASIALAMGSRYQIIPSGHVSGFAYKLDRLTGAVTSCNSVKCEVTTLRE
jgi:hypothetical protein